MYRALIFVILCGISSLCFAQRTDSLDNLLYRKKILDSLLYKVLPEIKMSNPSKALEICDEAESFLLEGLEKYSSIVYLNKAALNERIGEPDKALYNIEKSYDIALETNNMISVARALQFKGMFYGKRNDLIKSEMFIIESIEVTEKNLYQVAEDSLKNKNFLLQLKSNLSLVYTLQQKYEKAIPMAFNTLELARVLGNKKVEALLYSYIGGGYAALDQDEKALEYYLLENQLAIELKDIRTEAYSYVHIANTLDDIKDKKEMQLYYNKALAIFERLQNVDDIIKTKHNIFKNYRLNGQFDECLKMAPDIILLSEKDKGDLSKFYIELGEIYTKLKRFNEAEESFSKAEKLLDEKQLSKLYLNTKRTEFYKERGELEKALESKEQEIILSKQEINTSVVESLTYYDTKFKSSEKDKQILDNQSQIKHEVKFRNIIVLVVVLLFLIAIMIFIFYKRLLNKRDFQMKTTLNELQLDLTTMEIHSLNQQLDPHEIKNLLASISPEIQEKAPDSYKKMLQLLNVTKASLGNNSLTENVGIQVQQIEDFLSLKKSSLSEPLDYKIENKIENDEVHLPRLLLKNLVENSIKHGIKGKEDGGIISVSLEIINGFFVITINDTGKGRKDAISLDSGIGTSTYQKLFATLNQKNNEDATFNIFDKEVGTLVEVKIPIAYKYT